MGNWKDEVEVEPNPNGDSGLEKLYCHWHLIYPW
jgi:hypothetical protein